MREKINEEIICVLRKHKVNDNINVEFVSIDLPLKRLIDNFTALCKNPKATLEQIIDFIKKTTEFNQLSDRYRYCISLNGSYQAFNANNHLTISEILKRKEIMLSSKKESPYKYDLEKAIIDFKHELADRYILWHKAFSINKSYIKCLMDKSILIFSHRRDGWSNPVYQLTSNFSVEIKTNFGYGSASYFHSKLKYKEIEITPFSEWIDYELAKFSEIIRYTKKYELKNENWLDAMEFSRDACNLSMTDERKFIEKYVIDECESMVSGLENIFTKDHFSFKGRENTQYSLDKEGHVLVEFRGEKISGALDFIGKILEFEKIGSIKHFIDRIETCNKKMQPILIEESKTLVVKIANLKDEIKAFKPIHDKIIEVNNLYNIKKKELQNEMTAKGQLNPDKIEYEKLNREFNNNFPEYNDFKIEYIKVTRSFQAMKEQLSNLITVNENIISFNVKIINHFGQ